MPNDHQEEILEYLRMVRRCRRSARMRPKEFCFDGPEDFVLQHGQWYEPRQLPADAWRGAARCCFGNAIIAARAFGLTYVEGYASKVIPVHHGWCVDSEKRLYEVTWPEPGLAYIGVPFSVQRADDSTWNGDATVLTDPREGVSIYRQKWNGEDYSRQWPSSPRLEAIDEEARRRGLHAMANR